MTNTAAAPTVLLTGPASSGVRHSKTVEQRLYAIVNIAALHDDTAGLFSTE
jgi:hypothetical protein